MKDPTLYLVHIAESIAKIERYTGNVPARLSDAMVYDAVLRNLQTLSEAAQKLPPEIKQRHPDIPWQNIAGFRNILVHDYLNGIDVGIILRVLSHELPALKAAVLSELPKNVRQEIGA